VYGVGAKEQRQYGYIKEKAEKSGGYDKRVKEVPARGDHGICTSLP
jgi:hypothetical protein